MLVYYLLLLAPIVLLLRYRSYAKDLAVFVWLLIFILYTCLIGLRNNVGADWNAYIKHYELTNDVSLAFALTTSDPGYAFINWLVALIGGEIYLVNTVCAGVVVGALIAFAKREPKPWLYICLSMPFYIIIVGMSLTRQSVAIGFELLAVLAINDERKLKFFLYVICATLFHKTAIILFPLYVLVQNKNKLQVILAAAAFCMLVALSFVLQYFDNLYYYIEQEMESQGAVVRAILLFIPAMLFVLFRRKLSFFATEKRLWSVFAVAAIVCLPISFTSFTAIDRLMLYLLPLQPYVYARIPLLLHTQMSKGIYVSMQVIVHLALLFVWLNYSNNSIAWIPYDNLILQ